MIYDTAIKRYERQCVQEKFVAKDKMNLKEAMSWYNNFVRASKSKIDTKEELEERIDILNKCIKNMKRAKVTGKGKWNYAFNAIIPYNDICHFIENKEAYINMENLSINNISNNIQVASDEIVESLKPENIKDTLGSNEFKYKATKVAVKTASTVAGGPFGSVMNVVYRATTYNKMLDKSIEETEEAVDYLKNKLKEYK